MIKQCDIVARDPCGNVLESQFMIVLDFLKLLYAHISFH